MQARMVLVFVRMIRKVVTRVGRCWWDKFVYGRAIGHLGPTAYDLVVEGRRWKRYRIRQEQDARHDALEMCTTAAATLTVVIKRVGI